MMRRLQLLSFTGLAAVLFACSSGDVPLRSAANPAPPGEDDAASGDPIILDAAPGALLRWRTAPTSSTAVSSQAAEPKADGPIAYGQTSVTLENKGTLPLTGPLELVLPFGTFAASSHARGEATAEPLVELRMPEATGHVFTTTPIRLAPGDKRVIVIEHASMAIALPASGPEGQVTAPKSVAFMLDTSAARSHQLARQLEVASAYARSLPPETALLVGAYDSDVAPLYDGKAGAFGPGSSEKLAVRGAASTSNVERAIEWATRPRAEAPAPDRVVIVSDGIDGIDDIPMAAISRAIRDNDAAELRIDVLVPQGPRDAAALQALARELTVSPGAIVALEDERAATRLLGAADASSHDPRERIAREKGQVPTWVTGYLASARETPAARSWERIPALAKNVRALPTLAEQRVEVDPLEDYSARPQAEAAAEPITVTLSEPANTAAKPTAGPEERAQIPPETIRLIVRRNFATLRFCYREALRKDPKAGGKIVIRFDIDETGTVPLARAASSELGPEPTACFVRAFEALSFPASPSGTVTVSYPINLGKADGGNETPPPPTSMKMRTSVSPVAQAAPAKDPWSGDAQLVYEALARGDSAGAITAARKVVHSRPRDLDAHLLLGDALATAGDSKGAARAYGSLVELAPRDAAALRLAGGRFAALGPRAANAEAERCLTRALELEPAAASSYHMLAMLLTQRGAYESALGLLDQALSSPAGRTPATRELLRKDLSNVAATLVRSDARRHSSLQTWLARAGTSLSQEPSMLVVASWEDESDVDLTMRDRSLSVAEEAFPNLPSGGRVIADKGKLGGPEAFTLDQDVASRNYPFVPAVVSRRPTGGFVAGTLFRTETDGRGAFALNARPFFINVDGGRFEAPAIEGPLTR